MGKQCRVSSLLKFSVEPLQQLNIIDPNMHFTFLKKQNLKITRTTVSRQNLIANTSTPNVKRLE
jgi:hypothetical protein